jgi:hypothetical protein
MQQNVVSCCFQYIFKVDGAEKNSRYFSMILLLNMIGDHDLTHVTAEHIATDCISQECEPAHSLQNGAK